MWGLAALHLGCGASARPSLELRPCRLADVEGPAFCGRHEVWENRATRSGRRIPLRVVLLPARDAVAAPDPIVVLEGGPGASNVASARRFAASPLRIRRHFLLIDTRGTGGSAPLDCEFQSGHANLGYLEDFLPLDKVRACRDSLQHAADLAQYITPNVVDDLDEVRAALGLRQVNLLGSSGGTRQALVWIRRHPGRVRTALLEGPVPLDARIPLTFARDAQAALDGVLDECLADAACGRGFPNLRRELALVIVGLDRGPAPVRVTHPETGAALTLSLTRSAFAQVIRYMLYTPTGAAAVPLVVHRAAAGDFGPAAERALRVGVGRGISYGFYLSNTCAEDLPFFTQAEGEAESAGTLLGDYRVRQQKEACELWPATDLPAVYLDPVRSEVPVLILVGQRDPVTPPRWAEEVAGHLSHARVVVVPGGGHSFAGLENGACLDELRRAFVEAGGIGVPDPGCLSAVRRGPFLAAPSGR